MISRMLPVAFGIAVLGLALGLTTCGSLHPAPEVVVARVNPLSVSISDTTSDSEVQFWFFNGNRVDAYITEFEGGGWPRTTMSLFVPYGVKRDSLGLTQLSLTITYDTKFKKAHQNLINTTGQIVFRGVDAYGNNKAFTASPPVYIAYL